MWPFPLAQKKMIKAEQLKSWREFNQVNTFTFQESDLQEISSALCDEAKICWLMTPGRQRWNVLSGSRLMPERLLSSRLPSQVCFTAV